MTADARAHAHAADAARRRAAETASGAVSTAECSRTGRTSACSPRAAARTTAHVLVLSSDPDTRLGLGLLAESEGYSYSAPTTLAGAVAAERDRRPGLLFLDLAGESLQPVLPFAKLRAGRGAPAAYIVSAARAGEPLPGFRREVDELLVSPPHPAAVLRVLRGALAGLPRDARPSAGGRYRVGLVELDLARERVTRGGLEVPLTATQVRLLLALVRARGSVVSRPELWRAVWPAGRPGPTRALDTHIYELRKIIEPDPSRPTALVTHVGRGHRLVCGRLD